MTRFNQIARFKQSFLAAGLIGLVAVSTPAFAESGDFRGMTKIGSSGVVDEANQDEVVFKHGRAMIDNSIDEARVVLRYDIQASLAPNRIPVDSSFVVLNFKDNGPNAQVIAKLKSYNLLTGETHLLATFNSNEFEESNAYQTELASEVVAATIDSTVAYYVEVSLIKTGPGGKPSVGAVGAYLHES